MSSSLSSKKLEIVYFFEDKTQLLEGIVKCKIAQRQGKIAYFAVKKTEVIPTFRNL